MTRLAKEMGPDTITFAFPGFYPKEKMILDVTEKLAELNLNKKDTVVLDLLSNVVFIGMDNERLPSEALRAADGSYHVVESLTVAPPLLTKEVLLGCTSLAQALKGTGTVFISPVPRYVYNKCCCNIEHIENFEDPELDEEIVIGLGGMKKIMQNWALEHDLCFEIAHAIRNTIVSRPAEDSASAASSVGEGRKR
jgi:hypothetical protein